MERMAMEKILNDLESQMLHPELIQDNKIHFICDEQIYRVRMPKQIELSEVDIIKNSHYIQLLQEENTLLAKNLKKVLKEKQNIDIEEMENELIKLENELNYEYEALAPKKDSDETGLQKSFAKIKEIKSKRMKLILEISNYMTPAIETQVENYYMEWLTSKCTEKHIEEENETKWEPVWNSFEDYRNDSSNVRFHALGTLTKLILNTRA